MRQTSSGGVPPVRQQGLSIQELKQMTALRMSQQGGQAAPVPGFNNNNISSGSSTAYSSKKADQTRPPRYAAAPSSAEKPTSRPPAESNPASASPPVKASPHGHGRGADRNKHSKSKQESAMPQGLTVQELKELTRIRLQREAMEKMNGVGDSSIVSETSSDGESSRGTPAKKKGPSSYFAAASSLTGGVAHQQKTFTNDNSGDLRTDVSQSGGGRPLEHGGSRSVSDTSSTVSVSSSSTEEAFSQSLLPSRASLPWESIMASQSALPAGTSPSLTGSAIRELLSVNLPEEQYPPGLPPSPGRGFSLMSPKSLKNRPQIAIDCPDEIRRRTRSDSLALEMAEAVLGTPPGSPAIPKGGRKRVAGGSATMLLTTPLSPSQGYSSMDLSDEVFLRRITGSKSGDGGEGGFAGEGMPAGLLGNGFTRREGGLMRRGSGSSDGLTPSFLTTSGYNSSLAPIDPGSFFPRRNGDSNSLLSIFNVAPDPSLESSMGQLAVSCDAEPHWNSVLVKNAEEETGSSDKTPGFFNYN